MKAFDISTKFPNYRRYLKLIQESIIYFIGLGISVIIPFFIPINIQSSNVQNLILTIIQCQFTLMAILFSAIIIIHQLSLERYSNYISDFYRKSPELWLLFIFYSLSILFKFYYILLGLDLTWILTTIICFDSFLLIKTIVFFNTALILMTPIGTLKKLSNEIASNEIVNSKYYSIFIDTITASLLNNEYIIAREWIIEYNKLFLKFVKSTSSHDMAYIQFCNTYKENLIKILDIVEQVGYTSLLTDICDKLLNLRSLNQNFQYTFFPIIKRSCDICLNLKKYDTLWHLSNTLKNYAIKFAVHEKDINELEEVLAIFENIYYNEIAKKEKYEEISIQIKLHLTDIVSPCRLFREFDNAVNRALFLQINMLKHYLNERNWFNAVTLLMDIGKLQQERINKEENQKFVLEEFLTIISILSENYERMLFCTNRKTTFQTHIEDLDGHFYFSLFSLAIQFYVEISILLLCSDRYIKLLAEIALSHGPFMIECIESEFDFLSHPIYKTTYQYFISQSKKERGINYI